MQDRLLDDWRFRHGVPDAPMFIAELSKYRLYDPSKVNLANGDAVRILRRPDNADDPNAIEILKADKRVTLGFLPREVAALIAPILDAGADLSGYFHAESDVASGMIVISGEELAPALTPLSALSGDPETDTVIHVKAKTEDLTVSWYDENAALYDYNANRCNPKNDMGAFLSALPAGAKILDAGCGNGRDVARMMEMGYEVGAFDASKEMCRLTAERTEGKVVPRQIRFSEYDDAPDSWDGIWAMASLVHTPADEIADVVAKLKASLKPGGVFFASMKAGDAPEIMPDGRRIMRVNEDVIRECFVGDGDVCVARREAKGSTGVMDVWLNVMFTKAPEPELRLEA